MLGAWLAGRELVVGEQALVDVAAAPGLFQEEAHARPAHQRVEERAAPEREGGEPSGQRLAAVGVRRPVPGKAGIEAGRPHQIRVTDLFEEVAEEHGWVAAADAKPHDLPAVTTAVVAIGVGAGVQRLLSALGVQQIVAGGQSMNPSTAQILEAVELCNADSVIVLPNNKNIIAVAQQVPDLTDKAVEVVPTTSIVEALAALVAYDPDAPPSENVAALSEASQRVRTGEVTQAVRDSEAECGPIREGDYIAIERGGGIVASLGSASEACTALLDRLVDDDAEIVTIVLGADAVAHENARIESHLKLAHPHVDVEMHEGGQPLYPYLVGVE